MQQQMGQGPGPGRTGRLGPPRAQQDTDPLGRPLRGREYGDDYTVKVPGEIDVQRARRIIEELRRRFGDVLRPQEELATSPRWMPTRNSMRRSGGRPALRHGSPFTTRQTSMIAHWPV